MAADFSANQAEKTGATEIDDVEGATPERRALRLQVFTFAVPGPDSAGHAFLGVAPQFLIARGFDQYAMVDSLETTRAGSFRNEGITSPEKASLSLYHEFSEENRSDFMVTGDLQYSESTGQFSIQVNLHTVDPLKNILELQYAAGKADFYRTFDTINKQIANKISDVTGRVIEPIAEVPVENFGSGSWAAFESFTQAKYQNTWGENRPAAIKLLKQAVDQDSRFAFAWRSLYTTLDTSSDAEAIEEAIRNALRYEDRLSLEYRYWTRLAYYNITKPDNDTRLTLLRKFKDDFPLQTGPRFQLAGLYSSMGQIEQAIAEYDQLMALMPANDPSAHHLKAHLLESQNRFEEAVGLFEHVAQVKPDEPKSWYDLAWAHQQNLQLEDADKFYKKMLETGDASQEPFWLIKYFQFLNCRGQYTEAETVLSEIALWSDSDDEEITLTNLRINLFETRGQIDLAQKEFAVLQSLEFARLTSPEQEHMYEARSKLRSAWYAGVTGRFTDAENVILKVRATLNSPLNLGTRNAEFLLARRHGTYGTEPLAQVTLDESYTELHQFLEDRDPNYSRHDELRFRALWLTARGELEAAEQAWLELIEKNPGDTDHFISLAELANKQGKPNLALDYLSRGPGFCPMRWEPLLQEARARLLREEYELAAGVVVKLGRMVEEADRDYIYLRDLDELRAGLEGTPAAIF